MLERYKSVSRPVHSQQFPPVDHRASNNIFERNTKTKFSMKNAIAILLCALLGLASAVEYKLRTPEDLQAARKECGASSKVTEALIAKYKALEYPDDEITRNYIKCIFIKFDLFEDTKGFKVDNLVSQLGQGKEDKTALKADIEKCADKNEQKSPANVWVYRGFKCFLTKNLPLVQAAVQKNN